MPFVLHHRRRMSTSPAWNGRCPSLDAFLSLFFFARICTPSLCRFLEWPAERRSTSCSQFNAADQKRKKERRAGRKTELIRNRGGTTKKNLASSPIVRPPRRPFFLSLSKKKNPPLQQTAPAPPWPLSSASRSSCRSKATKRSTLGFGRGCRGWSRPKGSRGASR